MFHSNHRSNSHRFEAGANVCSADRRVGPLSPPLLENGLTDFDAVWFLAYLIGSPVSLRRNHQSTYRRFAGMHVLTDRQTDRRQTDRQHAGNTDSSASDESAKIRDGNGGGKVPRRGLKPTCSAVHDVDMLLFVFSWNSVALPKSRK